MTRLRDAQVELWVEPRDGAPAVNPIMSRLLQELAATGASVAVRVPEFEVTDPLAWRSVPAPDLVLLKSATTLALSLATAGEAQGVAFLNGARASVRAHDKAETVARLAAAGLPVPPTYLLQVGGWQNQEELRGAWISKPTRGVHGLGVSQWDDLRSEPPALATRSVAASYVLDDGTRLVQRRIGGTEPDLKVYVASGRCFAGAKSFSSESFRTDRIEPVRLDPATEALVLRVGQVLGLTCFGVDLRFEAGEPVVIDANPFPGYRGFEEAVPAMIAEIERMLGGVE